MELIRGALFVSTITGSLGNEAAIFGKRSLIFGDAWYLGMPNVIRWKEDLTYKKIMEYSLSSHNKILNYFLGELDANYIVGCQNTSAENRFKSYIDSEFRESELSGLFYLFTQLALEIK